MYIKLNGNNNINNNTKKGITLVVLVITIIVGLILVSASVVTVNSSINDAKKVAFAEELNEIEDQVLMYNLQNGEEYPAYTNSDETFLSKTPSEIKSIIGEEKFNILKEEMKINKENGDSDITVDTPLAFYVIDLDKLSLDKKTRGIMKDNNQEDVYVVSAKTKKVYYLKGLKIGKETYFSLANIISYAGKVESTESGEIEVTEVGALTLKRAKKTWSNTMGITLSVKGTTSDTTNTIEVRLKNEEGEIGNSSFEMESEYTITLHLDLLDIGFKSREMLQFIRSNQKIMEFTKGEDTVVVDLSNYDPISPSADLNNLTKNILKNGNVLTFKVSDTLSGIKEVKYDYLTKYDENGDIQNYYKDTTTLEASFIKARGKKADISAPDENGDVTVTIKVPVDIEGIQLYVADKAGNYTTKTIGVYDFDNDPYIGCNLRSITNAGLTFKAVFNTNDSNKKLTKYTAKVSTDNTTFAGDYSETLSTSKEKYSKLVEKYKNGLEIQKKVYVKITATIAGTLYERIFEFDIADADKLDHEEDGNMLMVDYGYSQNETFLRSNVRRRDIRYIYFEKDVVPETYIRKFDASLKKDNSIIGYVIYINTDMYDIVISSDKKIYACWDSSGYFKGMVGLGNITFNNFDTSKVTDMSDMFRDCGYGAIEELDFSSFDTSGVTNMSGMFASLEYNTSKVHITLDVSNFDTSNVTDMSYMFNADGPILGDIIIGKDFDTSKVTNMSHMFDGLTWLTSLDVSNFDTSNVIDMSYMFNGCSKVTNLYASNKFVTTSVTDSSNMFNGCKLIVGGNGTTYNSSYVDKTYARIDKSGQKGYFTAK